MRTLLQIIQDAAVAIGIPRPAAALSFADPQVLQLVEMAQQEGDDLSRAYDWSELVVPRDFTCVATEAQDEPPIDWSRYVRDVEIWNVARQLPITGPVDASEWVYLTTRVAQTEPQYWRMIGGKLNIYTPVAGETVRYEYVTTNWILSNDGSTFIDRWTHDGDSPRLPSRLIKQGIVWRWKQKKGLDYAEDMATYERWKEIDTADNRGNRRIRMSKQIRGDLPLNFWPGRIS